MVGLRDYSGTGRMLATQRLAFPGGNWTKLNFTLTPTASTDCVGIAPGSDPLIQCTSSGSAAHICVRCGGEFLLGLEAPGTVNVDYVFLQPGSWGRFEDLPVGVICAAQTKYPVSRPMYSHGVRGKKEGAALSSHLPFSSWARAPLSLRSSLPARCLYLLLLNRTQVKRSAVELLQSIGVTTIRQGGSFTIPSDYFWKRWRGPAWERPSLGWSWGHEIISGWGPFEMIDMCNAAGFEPIITTSADNGGCCAPDDMADLVEYCWGNESTTWGRQRIVDGHPLPYRVKIFELGNEQYNAYYPAQVCASCFLVAVRTLLLGIVLMVTKHTGSHGSAA